MLSVKPKVGFIQREETPTFHPTEELEWFNTYFNEAFMFDTVAGENFPLFRAIAFQAWMARAMLGQSIEDIDQVQE